MYGITHMLAQLSTHTRTNAYTRTNTHTYTHIHTHTHTYTKAHIISVMRNGERFEAPLQKCFLT
jgi:hypothetical protein